MGDLVLVTGASGYIAQHTLRALSAKGFRVRGTVRSPGDAKLAAHLATLCPKIELVKGDLLSDDGWDEAVTGCRYVVHMASPFTLNGTEAELIPPAVDGTRRVLSAAAKAGVKRVVLTSSCAAIAYGRQDPPGYIFTPADWSDPAKIDPYTKRRAAASEEHSGFGADFNKTLAERTAWDLVRAEPAGKMELVTINPSLVVGPVLSTRDCTSASICLDMFTGKTPVVPHLGFGAVDVRDVADAHVSALTAEGVDGKRFIASAASVWLDDLARILAGKFRPLGYKISTTVPPKWLLWIASFFMPQVRGILPNVDKPPPQFDNSATVRELGVKFRDPMESFVEMGQSLIDLGLVEKK